MGPITPQTLRRASPDSEDSDLPIPVTADRLSERDRDPSSARHRRPSYRPARRTRIRLGIALVLVGILAFSAYGTLAPASARCTLPGSVGCPGGVLGPSSYSPLASQQQFFNVTLFDYGFWIINTVDGSNESAAWNVYEGWTVNVNATSLPPDQSQGGTAYHGLGVEINQTGTHLLSLDAPVGQWVSGSFTAPTTAYYSQRIWCTVYCGPGHSSQRENILNIVPSTSQPSVTVTATPSTGNPPLSVALNGKITGGTSPYNTTWNFGDGTPAAYKVNVTHVFQASGTYSAQLSVVDAKGQTAKASATVTVGSTQPLTATISVTPRAGVAPLVPQLSASATGGSAPYTFAWKFGDGSTGAGANPLHVFSGTGSFGVSVTVTDATGKNNTAVAAVSVKAPTGHFALTVSSTPSSGTAPINVTLSETPKGGTAPYTVVWLFGDGTTASGASVTHQYTATGSYEVAAFVTDSASATGVSLLDVQLKGSTSAPISTQILALPSIGSPPLLVNASVSIEGGSGNYTTVNWSFGDGANDPGQVSNHTYNQLGNYTLSSSITDSAGNHGQGSVPLEVERFGIVLSFNRTSGDSPFSVGAVASVHGATGTYNPVSWAWGDGQSSQGSQANHTYAANVTGKVTVTASVTDSGGDKATGTATLTIVPGPVANLSALVPPIKAFPVAVNFSLAVHGGSGSYSPDPLWAFGDGTTTRGPGPQLHTYARPGHYVATVTTNDSTGVLASASVTLNLALPPIGGTHGGPPEWIFNGLHNPTEIALVMIGVFALSALILLGINTYRRRKRPPAAAAAKPAGQPAPTAASPVRPPTHAPPPAGPN